MKLLRLMLLTSFVIVVLCACSPDRSLTERLRSAEQLRDQVHQEMLSVVVDKLQNRKRPVPIPEPVSRVKKHHDALESITTLEQSGAAVVTLETTLKNRPIQQSFGTFYNIITGNADQIAVSRSKLAESPMEELLFFNSKGEDPQVAAKRLGISPFVANVVEDVFFVRINTTKMSKIEVPLWWLHEDAYFLLLWDSILSRTQESKTEALNFVENIIRLRSSHTAIHVSQGDFTTQHVDELLLEIRRHLNGTIEIPTQTQE